MRRPIRELIAAAKWREADRSHPPSRRRALRAAVFVYRPLRPKRYRRPGRPVCPCGACGKCLIRAVKRRVAWLMSIREFISRHLGFPNSTLNPGTDFCIRRRGGAKTAAT